MELGGELAAITAGLDLLYRSSNRNAGILDAEGLIPVAVAEVEPRTFNSYEEAEVALLSLRDRLSQAETALRRDWLDEMSNSLLALIATFRGDPITFAVETGAADSRRCPRDTRRDNCGLSQRHSPGVGRTGLPRRRPSGGFCTLGETCPDIGRQGTRRACRLSAAGA